MNISLKGKGNLFEQIAEEYIRLINLGVYEPGYKLPSCRVLAKELGINPNTVEVSCFAQSPQLEGQAAIPSTQGFSTEVIDGS